ncbi:MAG: UDP-3-O-(3-hydroxymyristoyl)glucosamine N-acyltransferase, partial [Planctomycetota bacterium]
GHCSIADDVVVGAQSGVGNTLKEAGTYLGSPAVPIELCRKIYFYWSKLPQFSKRLKTVERRLADAAEREDQPQAE